MASKIHVSCIGLKIKNGENVKEYLANKAGIEKEELTVVEFKPASNTEKGVCVLTAEKEEVIDKIKKTHFQNWEVKIECLEVPGQSLQYPIDVTITYPDDLTPSDHLLQSITEHLKHCEVS